MPSPTSDAAAIADNPPGAPDWKRAFLQEVARQYPFLDVVKTAITDDGVAMVFSFMGWRHMLSLRENTELPVAIEALRDKVLEQYGDGPDGSHNAVNYPRRCIAAWAARNEAAKTWLGL